MKQIYLLLVLCCVSISCFAVCGTPPTAITGPTSVCTGNSITLSDGVTGGIWTSSAPGIANVGSSSGIVNGLAPGTATISYTTTGCTPATYVVTVNPYPNAIGGPAAVCLGSTITLTDLPASGAWSSLAPATASVDPVSGIVTGVSVGTATIEYALAGCAVSDVITVNPLPSPISGATIICLGSAISLSDLTGGGSWSSSAPGIANVNTTGLVIGESVGTAFITYALTATTGCYVTQIDTVVSNPPAITGPTSVCIGDVINLTDASLGGTWISSMPPVASVGPTGNVTGISIGVTTIDYTATTGCFTSFPVTVNANPVGITGPSLVCAGSTVTLSDLTPGGSWSSSAFYYASVGSSSGVVSGLSGGETTTISYTLSTGCFAVASESIVTPPSMIMGDTTICVGYTSTLTDSVAGGLWHSSAPGSLIVNPTSGFLIASAPGLVAVTYSITGCPLVTHNVDVHPVPAGISGPSSLCDSAHVDVYDVTTGGIWTIQDSTIARVTSYTDSNVVVGIQLGTTTISYTLPTGCYVVMPVTVNPLAPPISGTDTICSTGTAWLTDIVGGGIWTSSNPAIATIDPVDGFLTGVEPGVTFIVYTLPTGCSARLLETSLPAVPAISSPAKLCSGSTIDITDTEPGGVWSTNNILTASIVDTSGIISGLHSGTVTISYTVSAYQGCYATASIIVEPRPNPVITYDFAIPSVSTYSFYTSYQWYNDVTGLITGATTHTLVLPDYNDSVYVMVTDTNGCTSTVNWFYNDFTSVPAVSKGSVKVYPNPATSVLYIDGTVELKAVISGLDGKEIMEINNAKQMDVSALAPGMYFITLYDNSGSKVLTQKLIKE